MSNNEIFDWDSVIENDGAEFVVLPDGDYSFEVINIEKSRYLGGAKLPPCPQAIIELHFDGGLHGISIVKHKLFLHKKTEGLLCSFFMGIGQRKKGEPLKMNWNNVVGAKGTAKLGVRDWSYDGKDYSANEVKKFYEPSVATEPETETAGWKPGEY